MICHFLELSTRRAVTVNLVSDPHHNGTNHLNNTLRCTRLEAVITLSPRYNDSLVSLVATSYVKLMLSYPYYHAAPSDGPNAHSFSLKSFHRQGSRFSSTSKKQNFYTNSFSILPLYPEEVNPSTRDKPSCLSEA